MAVACGGHFTAVVTEAGEVWAWGKGRRLGLKTEESQLLPARVGGCEWFGVPIVALAAGMQHAAGVADDGALWTWGDGRLGHGNQGKSWRSQRPARLAKEVFGGSPAVMVACGRAHTVVVTAGGLVWTCGTGEDGRLGHGDTAAREELTDIGVERFGGAQIVLVAAGADHTVAMEAEGRVWSWGRGSRGCLGHNDEIDRHVPTQLADEAFGGAAAVVVAAGGIHTATVTEDGNLFTWGFGAYGQLGLGDDNNRLAPTKYYKHTHTRTYAHTHTHTQTHTHTHKHKYTHTHTNTNTHIYTNTHLYMYVCLYTHA